MWFTFAIVQGNSPGFGNEVVHAPLSKTSGRTFLDLFVEIQGTMQVQIQMWGSVEDNHVEMLSWWWHPGPSAGVMEGDGMKCWGGWWGAKAAMKSSSEDVAESHRPVLLMESSDSLPTQPWPPGEGAAAVEGGWGILSAGLSSLYWSGWPGVSIGLTVWGKKKINWCRMSEQ